MSALVEVAVVVPWPAAVSPLVAAAVEAPPRRRWVLGAFATCVYVELGRHDHVLAVHTPDAVQLPIGPRLAGPVRLDATARTGDVVTVGGGRVRLPGADIVAARRSRPSRVGRGAATASRASGSRGLLGSGVGARADRDVARLLAVLGGRRPPHDAELCSRWQGGRAIGHPSGADLLAGVTAVLTALTALTASAGPSCGTTSVDARAVRSEGIGA